MAGHKNHRKGSSTHKSEGPKADQVQHAAKMVRAIMRDTKSNRFRGNSVAR